MAEAWLFLAGGTLLVSRVEEDEDIMMMNRSFKACKMRRALGYLTIIMDLWKENYSE